MMRLLPLLLALTATPALAGAPDVLSTHTGPVDAEFIAAHPAPDTPAAWQALRQADPVRAAAWQVWLEAPEQARSAARSAVVPTRAGSLRLAGGPDQVDVSAVHLDVALYGSASESERAAHARAAVAMTGDLELVDAFLTQASPVLRGAALSALTRHPDPRAGELLAAGLQDADPVVREISASVLGRRADASALGAALARAAADPSADVRRLAVRGLGYHRLTAHQDVVTARLGDRDPTVRLAALRALERLDADAAVQRARTLVEDADPAVRRAAQGLLAE